MRYMPPTNCGWGRALNKKTQRTFHHCISLLTSSILVSITTCYLSFASITLQLWPRKVKTRALKRAKQDGQHITQSTRVPNSGASITILSCFPTWLGRKQCSKHHIRWDTRTFAATSLTTQWQPCKVPITLGHY